MNGTSNIIFLGTGNALATRCFNTCFIIRSRGNMLMVDAGGGNGILRQLELSGIQREDIHDLIVTHAHTDHILGVVWMMRSQNRIPRQCLCTRRYRDYPNRINPNLSLRLQFIESLNTKQIKQIN